VKLLSFCNPTRAILIPCFVISVTIAAFLLHRLDVVFVCLMVSAFALSALGGIFTTCCTVSVLMAVIALSELILREILLNHGVTTIVDMHSVPYAFSDACLCVCEYNNRLLICSCVLFSIQWGYVQNGNARIEFFEMLATFHFFVFDVEVRFSVSSAECGIL
jgi:hypothetical protein